PAFVEIRTLIEIGIVNYVIAVLVPDFRKERVLPTPHQFAARPQVRPEVLKERLGISRPSDGVDRIDEIDVLEAETLLHGGFEYLNPAAGDMFPVQVRRERCL